MTKKDPIYLNAEISNAGYDEETEPIVYLDAEKHISKSGTVVGKLDDYYASVFRLSFDLDVPIFIGEMQTPSTDGRSLVYSVTLKSYEGASVYRGRAYLKLPYEPSDVILYQTQPKDFYSSFWNYNQYTHALNEMISAAYAALITNGSSVTAGQAPFFNYNQTSGFFSLTAYPYNLYAYQNPPTGDRIEIYFNAASYPLLRGWDSYFTFRGNGSETPDANGEDYRLIIYNDGFNYLPQPAIPTSITPSAPTTSSISAIQSFPSALPGITTVRILSDLPQTGEFVQASGAKQTDNILADFKPDLSNVGGASVQIYNANFGDCRWVKLKGNDPLTQLTIRLQCVDYLGNSHNIKLYSKSEIASIKLCFAPNELVENFPHDHFDNGDDKGGGIYNLKAIKPKAGGGIYNLN